MKLYSWKCIIKIICSNNRKLDERRDQPKKIFYAIKLTNRNILIYDNTASGGIDV